MSRLRVGLCIDGKCYLYELRDWKGVVALLMEILEQVYNGNIIEYGVAILEETRSRRSMELFAASSDEMLEKALYAVEGVGVEKRVKES